MQKYVNFIFSIKFKIVLFSLILIILPCLILGAYVYFKLAALDKVNTSTYIINNLKSTADNIDDILSNIEYLSIPVVSDEAFLDGLKKLSGLSDSYSDYLIQKNMNEFLFDTNFKNKYINTIYLYSTMNKTAYSSVGTVRTFYEQEVQESPWLKDFEKATELRSKWAVTKSLHKDHSGGGYIVSLYKNLHLFSSNELLGIISFNVNEAHLYQLISKIKFKDSGYIFIVDKAGRIVSHTNRDLIYKDVNNTGYIPKVLSSEKEGYFIDKIDGQNCLVSYSASKYTGWKYVAVASLSEVISSATLAKNYLFVIYLLIILIIIFSVFIISSYLYRPIKKLFFQMKRVEEGDFSVSISHNRKDEFGYIYNRFNTMVKNIKALINDIYIQKLLRKEAQLKVIQTQINEHFLYNTLDSIHWAAKQHNTEDIGDITFSLSRFFRLSLSSGKDIIPVKDIVEMITCYLNIISIRFKNKLNYDIEADNTILDCMVLKYIFQPIVENAILHGIEKKKKGGSVKIIFKKRGELLMFSVSDNGAGIAEDKLNEIMKSIHSPFDNTEDNFALKNINSQIKLFYGEEYGLKITSTREKGTVVEFEIPIRY